ncbi:MAG: ABC transporter substrate-binding protein [Acidimicrobiia bacterium]
MKRTRKAIVVAVAAATVALASVAAAGTSAGAQSSVRGVTDSEIKVGGLGYSAFYESAGLAAKARFEQANKNGEIPGGRKINYIGFSDDKSTADVNLSEGRRLVDQEKVFAVVPTITPFLQAGTYFNQQKVPTLGWGISAAFCDPANKYIFGFTGCLVPNPPTYPGNTWGELVNKQLQAQGKGGAKGKAAAVIADNNDSGKSGVEVISATAEAVGMKVTYRQAALPPPPATVTDYSPYVQAIMTSNGGQPPDVVFLVVAQSNVFGLGRALAQAGFKGIQTNAVSYAPQLTSLANGWSAFTQFATPESSSTNMQKIVATLNAGGIETKDIGQPALGGYFAADQFVQILKKVGKNLTPERFQKVAAKFKYEIPDVIGPTYYPAGFKAGAPCGQLATSNGTAWSVTAPFACYNLLTKKGNKFVQVPYPSGVK